MSQGWIRILLVISIGWLCLVGVAAFFEYQKEIGTKSVEDRLFFWQRTMVGSCVQTDELRCVDTRTPKIAPSIAYDKATDFEVHGKASWNWLYVIKLNVRNVAMSVIFPILTAWAIYFAVQWIRRGFSRISPHDSEDSAVLKEKKQGHMAPSSAPAKNVAFVAHNRGMRRRILESIAMVMFATVVFLMYGERFTAQPTEIGFASRILIAFGIAAIPCIVPVVMALMDRGRSSRWLVLLASVVILVFGGWYSNSLEKQGSANAEFSSRRLG